MSLSHTVGAEATGDGFYKGRQHYVDELKQKIDSSPENLVLVLGPRRIGKTSVVKEYFEQCNSNDSDPGVYIYIYLSKIENLVDFYDKALEELGKSLIENSGKQKFLKFTTAGSSMKKAMDAVRTTISEVSVAGYGLKFTPSEEWARYISLLNTLKREFIEILKKFETKRIVIGFDEVPEAILYLLKNKKGAEEVEIWLEHFREMRHQGELKDTVKLILFGSVNMKLTMEKIGQSKVVNDPYCIEIEPLPITQTKELFWQLVETLKLENLKNDKELVNAFLEKMFHCCSPWAIQNFLDKYKKCDYSSPLRTNLIQSYLAMFSIIGGVRYLNERLGKYYSKDDEKYCKAILKYLAMKDIDENTDSVQDADLFAWAQEELKLDREGYQKIIDILLLDNMIYRLNGTGLGIKNTVECNFWYNTLVGTCKFDF